MAAPPARQSASAAVRVLGRGRLALRAAGLGSFLLLLLPAEGAKVSKTRVRITTTTTTTPQQPLTEHDWYFGWNGSEVDGGGVRGILDRAGVGPEHRMLHVGCGTSEVTESLWQNGFHNVTHLDLSRAVIEKMSLRLAFTNHSFQVGDMTALNFADGVFDVVLDKGALDFVYAKGLASAKAALRHVARVLRPKSGLYIMVSRFEPPQLLPSLSRMNEEGELPIFQECATQVHPLSPVTQIGARYSYTCREPARFHRQREF
mmetsp:Transcript_21225/g.49398  ORF Transcript_21225/g.49398 Transcript_21225/m.49398 type:complete len:260 (-) Transcript_21225:79-858(-)